jgi:FtsP/CotA-like multicopper oxidase with cupredoxin domain
MEKIMHTSRWITLVTALVMAVMALAWTADSVPAQSAAVPAAGRNVGVSRDVERSQMARATRPTLADLKGAAKNLKEKKAAAAVAKAAASPNAAPAAAPIPPPGPGDEPAYLSYSNWANSKPLRKFVDRMPGLGVANANNLGQYLTVANPDVNTYPGSDYYEIALVQYKEQMHSDLTSTTLRGYVQLNMGTDLTTSSPTYLQNVVAPSPVHYLGPTIVATKDRPVRIKFVNQLPTGAAGDLFLPVDTTVMGSGQGPEPMYNPDGTPLLGPDGMPMREEFKQNRATVHLHGGRTPWISDGTAHQWTTPAGEQTSYPKGVSVQNVPDMPDPGPGALTFYYSNQQSARLLFYHDHAWGITRLNVYAGEAAGYLITDDTEKALVASGAVPAEQIPWIIQDKSWVNPLTIAQTDPTWNWGTTAPVPHAGDLWYPHVYVPAQNPEDISGMNPYGRWHYGPWFWPPTSNIPYLPKPNPYYDPINAPWEPTTSPNVPNPSMPGESFFDNMLVNGTAYPYMEVQPKAYRFRILNAANDRFVNLQMFKADPTTQSLDGRTLTEVKMLPAGPTAGWPELWPTDGRSGGVPDPATVGPSWIQIGTEGGFLPAPVVIPNQPITWNLDQTTFNMGNVLDHSLLIAPAERADVIVDFSAYAGQTLILYNDAPAAFPALDARYDYFTGAPDLTDIGGVAGTAVGFGPNIRTVMQIRVAAAAPTTTFSLTALQAAFNPPTPGTGVFATGQDPILVGQAPYNGIYSATYSSLFPMRGYARIGDQSMTFNNVLGTTITLPFKNKALHDEMGAAFDEYGRMSGKLGIEIPFTDPFAQSFVLRTFVDPATEELDNNIGTGPVTPGDGTQIWKITHNGVDTHPIHWHLYDLQVLNRVGWDNAIRPPDANELGWKDTIRISPLEDTIVAIRPVVPKQPFGIPESVRPLNPAEPLGSMMGFTQLNPFTGQVPAVPVENVITNFSWEYTWHCHILSHEEMDMMRPVIVHVGTQLPAGPSLSAIAAGPQAILNWTDATSPSDPATPGNPANEIGFRIERAVITGGIPGTYTAVGYALANSTTHTDAPVFGASYAYRIAAYNASGASVSNTRAYTPTAHTVPDAPVIGMATAGDAGATVEFTPPALNGGNAITIYTVTASTMGMMASPALNGGNAIAIHTVTASPMGMMASGTGSPITVMGLTNGMKYTLTVTATNVNGESLPSASFNAVIPRIPGVTTPNAPTGITAVAGVGQAIVSFKAPAIDGGNPISFYTVTSLPGGRIDTGTDSPIFITGLTDGRIATGAGSPIVITGLTDGTSYQFTVSATNGMGVGLPSDLSNAVVPGTVPGAPIMLLGQASGAQAIVYFAPPVLTGTGAILQYTVTSAPGGITATSLGAGMAVVNGLTMGLPYTFTVTATNVVGTSLPSTASNPVTLGTVPGAPTIGTATGANNSATVTFTPPASNGGGAITGYTATSAPGNRTATGTGSPITVTNLTQGTYYTFTVTARNAAGTGPASAPSASVAVGAWPNAPTAITATALAGRQARVTFTPPTVTGGFPISSYTVTSIPGGLTATGTESPLTVTGLTAGAGYRFTVTATTAAGTGGPSGQSNQITTLP